MELLAFQVWEIPYSSNLKQAVLPPVPPVLDMVIGVDSLQQSIMVHTTTYINVVQALMETALHQKISIA